MEVSDKDNDNDKEYVYLKIYVSNIISSIDKKFCTHIKDVYTFFVGQTMYHSNEVDENTSYVFSILTFMDFFISVYEEDNNELMCNYYFFTMFKCIIEYYIRESISFNQLLFIFDNFWSNINLYSFLISSIRSIDDELKRRLNDSIEHVISNYDIFLVQLCKCNINIFNILELKNIDIKFILKNKAEKDKDQEEVSEVANMLLSLSK
jgi:hypothetical protein